jgi:hypothetical protein
VAADLVDFRSLRQRFALARDGSAIGLFAAQGPLDRGAFDLSRLEWVRPQKEWLTPITKMGRTWVNDWFESTRPLVSGRPVRLDEHEMSMTAAVSGGGDRVILGTSFFVRCLDALGHELWRASAPATTWRVAPPALASGE